MHFDKRKKTYLSIRAKEGGGTRDVSVNLTSTADELIATAESIFFPDGMCFFGDLSAMIYSLWNFKCQQITKDGFTLGKYITTHSLTTVRLYLMTAIDDECTKVTQQQNASSLSRSLSATSCTNSSTNTSTNTSSGKVDLTSSADVCNSSTSPTSADNYVAPTCTTSTQPQPLLVGTSAECKQVKHHQDKEYQASLKTDQEKRNSEKKTKG